MGKYGRWQGTVSVIVAVCVAMSLFVVPSWAAQPLAAGSVEAQSDGKTISSGVVSVSGLESFGGLKIELEDGARGFDMEINGSHPAGEVTITVADEGIATVDDYYFNPYLNDDDWMYLDKDETIGGELVCDVKRCGTTYITVAFGSDSVTFPVIVTPPEMRISGVTKGSYHQAKLTWTRQPGVSGYLVQRAQAAEDYWGWDVEGSFKTIARVNGDAADSTLVEAPWGVRYGYRIVPYVSYNGVEYYNYYLQPDSEPEWEDRDSIFALDAPAVKLTATASGSAGTKLTWTADPGATKFEVLRSSFENGGYQVIAKPSSASYTDTKTKKGVRYCYKVRAVYGSTGSVDSNSYVRFTAAKSSVKRKVAKGISQQFTYGQYGWNWASPDKTSYYTSGSKLFAVCYTGSKLKVYGLNSSLARVSTKTVSLPKHDVWGGVYHAPDGSNYVAIGYNNPKESKTKTVIKVIKYSSGWKKGKTASIAGSASNEFTGIYHPFDAGNVSFDMQGDTLYLFTCREMFATSDGVHHQSNIGFSIDTKKMTARTDNYVYTSHSFNQLVRMKDGAIYLADHGDAYPRAIALGMYDKFGSETGTLREFTPFEFEGNTGDNFTGATMGGMEVGAGTVLVCGTAQPHNKKVAGVKGFSGSYKHNVYVTVTNLATGKSSVKWLTSINPKKGKKTVSDVRMVKLSDDRFAVLYSVTNDKTGKSSFHYDVVNAQGKRVLAKTYKNIGFTGGVQPVLYDGSLVWSECSYTSSGKKVTFYKVPAL